MTAFKDIRLDTNISIEATGGPGFLTNIVTTSGAIEYRDQTWSLERGEWNITYAARRPKIWQPLMAFFRIVRGRAYSWRFKDWLDYSATSSQGVFVMLTSTTFQMYKRYTFGSETYDRKITKPTGTVTVTGGSGATTALTTGIVTVSSGTPTAWAAEFDCHARFDTDKMHALTKEKSRGSELIIEWADIPIIELKNA